VAKEEVSDLLEQTNKPLEVKESKKGPFIEGLRTEVSAWHCDVR
jgi:hypothetical protein